MYVYCVSLDKYVTDKDENNAYTVVIWYHDYNIGDSEI